jgi:predicted nucleic acid-binding protein
MILVDTGIIIDFWKRPTQEAEKVFLNENVAICGVVTAELIHGAKSEKDIQEINKALTGFNYIVIDDTIWNDLGLLLYQLRTNGITVPFQDALMAVMAIKLNFSIWSKDKHFDMIQKVEPNLKIFTLP